MTDVLMKKKKREKSGNLDTETYIEERQCKMTAKKGGLKQVLPHGPQKEPTLLSPEFGLLSSEL